MNTIEHLLTILQEECAEVSQRAAKAIRFGLDEVQEGQPFDNHARLAGELKDLLAAVELLNEETGRPLITADNFKHLAARKEKVRHWMTYSKERGRLE